MLARILQFCLSGQIFGRLPIGRRLTTCPTVLILTFLIGSIGAQELPEAQGWLRQIRFSPDGKYVLAQDASEITVLSVQPFRIVFRLSAEKADLAHFTPDSREIVFVGSTTRVDPYRIALAGSPAHVERWSLTTRTRVASVKLPVLVCGTEELSPDGEILGCLDLKSTLRFLDVASGRTIFEKKEFTWLFRIDSFPEPTYLGQLGRAYVEFSPDSDFAIVRPQDADGSVLVLDTHTGTPAQLPNELRSLKRRWSAWISSRRILLEQAKTSKDEVRRGVINAEICALPSGRVVEEVKIPNGLFFRAADPDFIVIRAFGEYRLGQPPPTRAAVAQLATGLVIISNTLALDAFGHFYAGEPAKGEVGLYDIGKGLRTRVILREK